ncbi:hypothetical protein [Streptococcus thoraltensis]|uniref:hypothetical protein n=1 Tax=Streptococcus thoraltensis TaxID=55085 RepID=UPI0003A258F8|nr:hypothetical protein [Streptococcus thoraltensis]MDY4761649.1 hypothetical protein [Streptococcus thoraltensis]
MSVKKVELTVDISIRHAIGDEMILQIKREASIRNAIFKNLIFACDNWMFRTDATHDQVLSIIEED